MTLDDEKSLVRQASCKKAGKRATPDTLLLVVFAQPRRKVQHVLPRQAKKRIRGPIEVGRVANAVARNFGEHQGLFVDRCAQQYVIGIGHEENTKSCIVVLGAAHQLIKSRYKPTVNLYMDQ